MGARTLTAIATVLAAGVLVAASPHKPPTPPFERVQLLPVDGAESNAEFRRVRDAVLEAAKNRDADALLAHVSDDLKCSFGGDDGKADFIAMWGLDEEPAKSPLWVELEEVMRLGGTWETSGNNTPMFMAPYVFGQWPDAFDTTTYGAIVGDNVNVRAGPGLDYWVVDQVDYLIVRFHPEAEVKQETLGDETFPWQRINLPDGQIGYVWGKYLRSPIGYRAGFELVDGRWQMTSFLAGD